MVAAFLEGIWRRDGNCCILVSLVTVPDLAFRNFFFLLIMSIMYFLEKEVRSPKGGEKKKQKEKKKVKYQKGGGLEKGNKRGKRGICLL